MPLGFEVNEDSVIGRLEIEAPDGATDSLTLMTSLFGKMSDSLDRILSSQLSLLERFEAQAEWMKVVESHQEGIQKSAEKRLETENQTLEATQRRAELEREQAKERESEHQREVQRNEERRVLGAPADSPVSHPATQPIHLPVGSGQTVESRQRSLLSEDERMASRYRGIEAEASSSPEVFRRMLEEADMIKERRVLGDVVRQVNGSDLEDVIARGPTSSIVEALLDNEIGREQRRSLRGRFDSAKDALSGRQGLGHGVADIARNLTGGGSTDSLLNTSEEVLGRVGSLTPGMLGKVLSYGSNAIGLGATAFLATQEIGEQYQNLKNTGLVQGGGFSEGLSQEMKIRSLALNPFINTQQAREIMNTALNEGYSGEAFDNLTGFMAQNLKELNMGARDSMKQFKTSVEEGGQSITGLASQLYSLKSLADGSSLTLPQMQAQYQAVTKQGVDAGLSGAISGEIAMQSVLMYGAKDGGTPSRLSAHSGAITQALMSSETLLRQAATAQGISAGQSPEAILSDLGDNAPAALMAQVVARAQSIAKDHGLSSGNVDRNSSEFKKAADRFITWVNTMLPSLRSMSYADKVEWFVSLLTEGNAAATAQKEQESRLSAYDLTKGLGPGSTEKENKKRFQQHWEDSIEMGEFGRQGSIKEVDDFILANEVDEDEVMIVDSQTGAVLGSYVDASPELLAKLNDGSANIKFKGDDSQEMYFSENAAAYGLGDYEDYTDALMNGSKKDREALKRMTKDVATNKGVSTSSLNAQGFKLNSASGGAFSGQIQISLTPEASKIIQAMPIEGNVNQSGYEVEANAGGKPTNQASVGEKSSPWGGGN